MGAPVRALSAAVLLALAAAPAAADERLKTGGGPGGTPFTAPCPEGQLLSGFELRAGDDIDAIRTLCVSAIGGPSTSAASPSAWHGGNGGTSRFVRCPPRLAPIVSGLRVVSEGADTLVVNAIELTCGWPDGSATPRKFDDAAFHGPTYQANLGGRYTGHDEIDTSCPAGMVGVGVHGRSGALLDALGLICGTPTLGVRSIGRRTPQAGSAPRQGICDLAADARARNSPAAPALQERCNRSKGE